MKIITNSDIQKLNISPLMCYDWVSEMIINKNCALLPPKISMKPWGGVFCNVMPSIINDAWGGVKIVTRYPERAPSLDSKIVLYNVRSGDFCATLDGNWITAMRTGAVAAHSIKLFAKNNFSTIGVIGLGNTARAVLLVLASLYPMRVFDIKLYKYKSQEVEFVKRFSKYKNLRFSFVDSYYETIHNSDVVISAATYFHDDIASDDAFDEGVLIVPVHTCGFTNCDLFFDKVFVDDIGHVCHFKNFSKFKFCAEVSDVVTNKTEGRTNDKERIIAYNIGIAIHDIYFASKIFQMVDKNNCSDIDFEEPIQKFWI